MGPASAPPMGVPALASPTAVAICSRGNQLRTNLLAAAEKGPSPHPNTIRTNSNETKPPALAVKPQKADQTVMARVRTRFGPNTSAAYPPIKVNNA